MPESAFTRRLRQRDPKLARSRLEALLSMASGAVAEPVAGLAGLLGAATGGAGRGTRAIEATRNALTYQPRDPRGMQEIASAVAPIASRIEQGKRYLGDSAYNATGSPALAAAAYTAPEGLAALVGLRGAGMRGPTMTQMAERSAGPTMGAPQGQVGAINPAGGVPKAAPEYGMAHRPVTIEGGAAPLHDLTASFGDDIYGPNAAQYFGTGDARLDRQTLQLLSALRGQPDALVSVYRAVPADVNASGLAYGDWVTVNRAYAEKHGNSALGGQYRIIEERVPASHLTTNADSFHEQGYHPPK